MNSAIMLAPKPIAFMGSTTFDKELENKKKSVFASISTLGGGFDWRKIMEMLLRVAIVGGEFWGNRLSKLAKMKLLKIP